MEKKVKAEAKRARRMERKQDDGTSSPPKVAGHPDLEPADYAAYFPPEEEEEPETPDETDKTDKTE
jgi:hypothetical protein